jgi:hypothetical protein
MSRDHSPTILGLLAEAARALPYGTARDRAAYVMARKAELEANPGAPQPQPYFPKRFPLRTYSNCSQCTSRRDIYDPFPTCRTCREEVCEACSEPGTTKDHEDRGLSVECKRCSDDFRVWLLTLFQAVLTPQVVEKIMGDNDNAGEPNGAMDMEAAAWDMRVRILDHEDAKQGDTETLKQLLDVHLTGSDLESLDDTEHTTFKHNVDCLVDSLAERVADAWLAR